MSGFHQAKYLAVIDDMEPVYNIHVYMYMVPNSLSSIYLCHSDCSINMNQ